MPVITVIRPPGLPGPMLRQCRFRIAAFSGASVGITSVRSSDCASSAIPATASRAGTANGANRAAKRGAGIGDPPAPILLPIAGIATLDPVDCDSLGPGFRHARRTLVWHRLGPVGLVLASGRALERPTRHAGPRPPGSHLPGIGAGRRGLTLRRIVGRTAVEPPRAHPA